MDHLWDTENSLDTTLPVENAWKRIALTTNIKIFTVGEVTSSVYQYCLTVTTDSRYHTGTCFHKENNAKIFTLQWS